jgi:hypothetical protein
MSGPLSHRGHRAAPTEGANLECAATAAMKPALPGVALMRLTTRPSRASRWEGAEATTQENEDLARGITEALRQDVSNGGHGLPMRPAMCDNVTHEGDLNQGAAPAHWRVGASGPETRVDSRPRSAHAGRDADARQRRASDQPLRAMETAEAIREGHRSARRRDARRGHHQFRSRPLKPSPCLRQPPPISMPHWWRSST